MPRGFHAVASTDQSRFFAGLVVIANLWDRLDMKTSVSP